MESPSLRSSAAGDTQLFADAVPSLSREFRPHAACACPAHGEDLRIHVASAAIRSDGRSFNARSQQGLSRQAGHRNHECSIWKGKWKCTVYFLYFIFSFLIERISRDTFTRTRGVFAKGNLDQKGTIISSRLCELMCVRFNAPLYPSHKSAGRTTGVTFP